MARPSREWLKTLYLVAFLVIGLLLVHAGALPLWLWAVLSVVTVGVRVIVKLDAYQDELSVTDVGVTRRHGSRMRKTSEESVRWNDLQRVEVLTKEVGQGKSDLLLLLHGKGSSGVAIAGPLAQQHGLPELLARKLPGFRNDEWLRAQAASEAASFVLWEKNGSD